MASKQDHHCYYLRSLATGPAIDGLFLSSKYFIMETVGMAWTTQLREQSLTRVLNQDKKWFNKSLHAPWRLV